MKQYILIFFLFFSFQAYNQQPDFLVKPYLQIGKTPTPESMQVLWHAAVSNDVWLVEYKSIGGNEWIRSENQTRSKIAVAGIDPFTVYSDSFRGLEPGSTFMYRVSKNGKVVFGAEAKALKSPEQSYRVAISGDMGAGTGTAKRIAFEIYKAKPDMVAIAGDIVYNRGLMSEYNTKFWPVYNKDDADTLGAPLLRSIPFVAAVGNHDASTRDLDRFP